MTFEIYKHRKKKDREKIEKQERLEMIMKNTYQHQHHSHTVRVFTRQPNSTLCKQMKKHKIPITVNTKTN